VQDLLQVENQHSIAALRPPMLLQGVHQNHEGDLSDLQEKRTKRRGDI
jgi:hypothetical protein